MCRVLGGGAATAERPRFLVVIVKNGARRLPRRHLLLQQRCHTARIVGKATSTTAVRTVVVLKHGIVQRVVEVHVVVVVVGIIVGVVVVKAVLLFMLSVQVLLILVILIGMLLLLLVGMVVLMLLLLWWGGVAAAVVVLLLVGVRHAGTAPAATGQ